MTFTDQSLIQAFASFPGSVDRIATFRTDRDSFLARLPCEVRAGADEETLVWRLFQLRKKGLLSERQSSKPSA